MANPKFRSGDRVRIKEQGGVDPIPSKELMGKCGIIARYIGSSSTGPTTGEEQNFPNLPKFAYMVDVEGTQNRIIEEWLEPCE